MTTLAQVSEQGLLTLLSRRLRRRSPGVSLGIGDDAALLADVGPEAVLTADMLVEGVDFELGWASFADVGHKAAAANLSDLAAMGAEPRGLLVSLGLRRDDRVADVLALMTRLDAVGRRFGAPVVGGDVSSLAGPLVVAVTAIGQVARRRALRRGRGRPGDVVLVSGALGGAALGLQGLMQGAKRDRFARRQLRPEPRVALGRALARAGVVRAAADLSDGLARDALHLAGPGCAVVLEVSRLPLEPGLARAAAARRLDAIDLALAGGEDFELVLAVPRQRVQRALVAARLPGQFQPLLSQFLNQTVAVLDWHADVAD